MSEYDPRMEDLPLFISYSRSGSTWVNCVMELYFNRPRLRERSVTFLRDKKDRTDYMWFHDHDLSSDLKVKHNNILYLYRNPAHVIFSLIRAEHPGFSGYSKRQKEDLINGISQSLKKHYKKYLGAQAKVYVSYENLTGDNYRSEFKKIIKFLDKSVKDIDFKRLDEYLAVVTRREIIKRERDARYFNRAIMLQPYRDARVEFEIKYGDIIANLMSDSKLNRFLKK